MSTRHLPRAILPGRLTVRLRLTLLYGGLFLAAGVVLLAISYALVRRAENPALAQWPANTLWLVLAPGFIKTQSPTPPQIVAQVQAAEAHQLITQFVIVLAVMAVLSAGLGWLVAGRVLRPLQVMAATARRLSEQNLNERFSLAGPRDELHDLADVFDTMLDRLQAGFDRERRFAANVSHELRTPLAITQTLLDVGLGNPAADTASLREMGERVRQVNHRATALAEGLLALARSEQGTQAREPVNLATVAADAIDAAKPEATARGLHIDARLSPATVTGDRAFLDRLAGNLIENAIRHNQQDGQIQVTTSARDGRVEMAVANTGPPINPAQIPALFEPFHRGPAQHGQAGHKGAGLGLSIVTAIVTAHHGAIDAQALPAGGLSVTVTFTAERD
jgi:signal transduction histidine kinase